MGGKLELWNQALSLGGVGVSVSDETENSPAARVLRRWFDQIVRHTQSTAPWTACRAFARLSPVGVRDFSESWVPDDPSPYYLNKFQTPADMLIPYHLESFQEFSLIGNALSCQENTPILYYNRVEVDVTKWEQPLYSAIMYMLAAHITEELSKNRAKKTDNFGLAFDIVEQAQVRSANSGKMQVETLPDWITARGYAYQQPNTTRYYFPMAKLRIGFES